MTSFQFRSCAVTVSVFFAWFFAFVISMAYLPFQQVRLLSEHLWTLYHLRWLEWPSPIFPSSSFSLLWSSSCSFFFRVRSSFSLPSNYSLQRLVIVPLQLSWKTWDSDQLLWVLEDSRRRVELRVEQRNRGERDHSREKKESSHSQIARSHERQLSILFCRKPQPEALDSSMRKIENIVIFDHTWCCKYMFRTKVCTKIPLEYAFFSIHRTGFPLLLQE